MEHSIKDKLATLCDEFRKQGRCDRYAYHLLWVAINDMMEKTGTDDRYHVEGSNGSIDLRLMKHHGEAIAPINFESLEEFGIRKRMFKNSSACFKLSPNSLAAQPNKYDGINISVCNLGEYLNHTNDPGIRIRNVKTMEQFIVLFNELYGTF